MRLTIRNLNRTFRARGITARLEKQGNVYVLLVTGREGGFWQPYRSTRVLNKRTRDEWVQLARGGVEWARERDQHDQRAAERAEKRNNNLAGIPRINLNALVDQWGAVQDKPDNDGPLGNAAFVRLEVVHRGNGARDWITIENGPDLHARFDAKRNDLYGDDWRLSKGAIQKVDDGVFRLPKEEPVKEPDISLEDAIALAHLVAEDLAEGQLKDEKVRIVQELVGGRVRQAAGSYKYVLLVGRWAIKVDKRKKPGDIYYIGAAGEALLIQSIKEKHAEIAKHFPITAVVNYYTAVQERADIDQTLYSRKKDLITKIANLANIGDYHAANVGFRPGDDTPIFIDVAGSNNVHAADHHHLNDRFMAEYELDKAKKELADREREIAQHRTLIAELSTKLTQLNVGA